VAQHGSVHLRSGRWDWSAWRQSSGASVTFRHRDRIDDELRAWTSNADVSPAAAEELAKEPLERRWSDADGLLWSLRLEFPSDWGRQGTPREESSLSLVFARGPISHVALVPADCKLGELTHHELSALFRDSL
jgi:hypothetical protein